MKHINKIYSLLAIIFCFWMIFSWVDIVKDNTEKDPSHSEYNLFEIICDLS